MHQLARPLGALMNFRILLRCARFVADYWLMPFSLGCLFAVLLITTGEYILVDEFVKAFETVISSCAQ